MSAALRIIFCAAFTSAFVTPAVPHRAVMPQHPARRAVPKAYTPDLDATIDGIDVTSLSTPSLPQVISIRGGGNLSPSAVTALGAVVNVMLSLLKLFVGTASGSAALVADAYHSGSDLLVDAVTMLAVHAPPSFERAATLVIAGLLSTAGVAMMWSAGLSLWRRSAPVAVLGTPPLLVALVAIRARRLSSESRAPSPDEHDSRSCSPARSTIAPTRCLPWPRPWALSECSWGSPWPTPSRRRPWAA